MGPDTKRGGRVILFKEWYFRSNQCYSHEKRENNSLRKQPKFIQIAKINLKILK